MDCFKCFPAPSLNRAISFIANKAGDSEEKPKSTKGTVEENGNRNDTDSGETENETNENENEEVVVKKKTVELTFDADFKTLGLDNDTIKEEVYIKIDMVFFITFLDLLGDTFLNFLKNCPLCTVTRARHTRVTLTSQNLPDKPVTHA